MGALSRGIDFQCTVEDNESRCNWSRLKSILPPDSDSECCGMSFLNGLRWLHVFGEWPCSSIWNLLEPPASPGDLDGQKAAAKN